MRTWSEIMAYGPSAIETWECGRALNQRSNLTVMVYKGRRYRADRKEQTTEASLKADGWKLDHRMKV
jgi:hypothetical protein